MKKLLLVGVALLLATPALAQPGKKCESIKTPEACTANSSCAWVRVGTSSQMKCRTLKATPRRTSVIVPAPLPVPPQLESIPLIAVPPLLVLYDLNRRVNCLLPPDPLGLGGPGFDGKPMPVGNVMVPCYMRTAIAERPSPR